MTNNQFIKEVFVSYDFETPEMRRCVEERRIGARIMARAKDQMAAYRLEAIRDMICEDQRAGLRALDKYIDFLKQESKI